MQILRLIWDTFRSSIGPVSVLDVILVAVAVYYLMLLLRGTRAFELMKGLAVLLLLIGITKVLGLATLNWLLSQALLPGVIALVILFQPEMRLALARLGRGRTWRSALRTAQATDPADVAQEIVAGARHCSREHVGALIVIEREIALDDFMSTGKEVDAVVSAELLRAIFSPASRLHDGAVVVRGDRIAAASCVLPLTERDDVGALLGTRHRAALGLSETTDAAVVVVSEESGAVSLTVQGRLFTGLADGELTSRLVELLKPSEPQPVSWFRRIKRASAKSGL